MATTTTITSAVQPAYAPPIVAYPQPAYVAPAPVVITQTTQRNSMREAIPSLPMPVAVLYAILNFIFPGLGTILAGFSVLCCGNIGQSGGSRVGTFCINFWVGILQILTAWLIVGWIWSIIWGVALISSAADDGKTTTTTAVVAPAVQPVFAVQPAIAVQPAVVGYQSTTTTINNQGNLPGY